MGIDSYNSTVKQRLLNASKTRVLQLKDSALRKVPDEIEELSSLLRNLELGQNQIVELPAWIGKFQQLKQLHLSRNSIEVLPDAIGQLGRLEVLNVAENKLYDLPETLVGCGELKTFDASGNLFVDFPASLCGLKNIESVNLNDNKIASLPDEIESIKTITLTLVNNRLNVINADSVSRCERLRVLQIDKNQLSRDEIEKLVAVAPPTLKVTFEGNVSQLHTEDLQEMGNESSKQKSTGTSSGSSAIRKVIGKTGPSSSTVNKHLEMASKSRILQLKGSGLKKFPEEIFQLAELLRTLELSDNKIREVPVSIGTFSQLKQLHLSNNNIALLPDEIGHMKRLEVLNVAGNQLTTVPDTIAGCTALRTIDLSANAFSVFPRALFAVMQIDVVNLNANRIEVLPDEISELKTIELSMNQNRLRSLNPSKLLGCPRLRVLRVEENCLEKSEFSRELLEQSQIGSIAFIGNLFQDSEFQALHGYEAYQERYTATRRKM